MTPERKHIAAYLTSFIEENYDKLSDLARYDEDLKKVLSIQELIELVNTNEDVLEWFLTEELRYHIDGEDVLESLIVYESNINEYDDYQASDDYSIYKINNKFIKHWTDEYPRCTNYFQFVEQKTKLVEVTYYE